MYKYVQLYKQGLSKGFGFKFQGFLSKCLTFWVSQSLCSKSVYIIIILSTDTFPKLFSPTLTLIDCLISMGILKVIFTIIGLQVT